MNLGFHFMSDDVRQRGLAKTRGAEKERVIKGLVTIPGGVDKDPEVGGETSLADKLLEMTWAKGLLEGPLPGPGIGGEHFLGHDVTLPYRPRPAQPIDREDGKLTLPTTLAGPCRCQAPSKMFHFL